MKGINLKAPLFLPLALLLVVVSGITGVPFLGFLVLLIKDFRNELKESSGTILLRVWEKKNRVATL